MKLSVKVPRPIGDKQRGHQQEYLEHLDFVVESSAHDSSRECFAEIGGTVKAINRDAYAIFKDALDDLHE